MFVMSLVKIDKGKRGSLKAAPGISDRSLFGAFSSRA
jgi:hypothetical protein